MGTSKSIYFTHYSNALSDTKIVRLRSRMGIEGYGIYFALLEKLSATNEYMISVDDIADIAFDLRVDMVKIESVIRDYKLFRIIDNYFFSDAHRLVMCYKDDRADKKRTALKARLEKLTPEQLSEQNKKAADARWTKDREEKREKECTDTVHPMHDDLASKCETMHSDCASDALNKNKDKEEDKNKERDKEQKEETPSGSEKSSSLSQFKSEDGIKIQNQINEYLQSNNQLFKGYTQNLVEMYYRDYIKQYPYINIIDYEMLLLYYLSTLPEITNVLSINGYLQKNPIIIGPNSIKIILDKVLAKDTDITNGIIGATKIIREYDTQNQK